MVRIWRRRCPGSTQSSARRLEFGWVRRLFARHLDTYLADINSLNRDAQVSAPTPCAGQKAWKKQLTQSRTGYTLMLATLMGRSHCAMLRAYL